MNDTRFDDVELAVRLEEALHDTLDGEPVDLARLVQGTRREARRARAARRVGLAVACAASIAAAAVVVPAAIAHVQGRDRSLAPPGTLSSPSPSPIASSTPSPSDTPSRTPSPTLPPPSLTDPASLGDSEAAYPIPDSVAFRQADFPRPLPVLGFDSHQLRLQPAVPDQGCASPRTARDKAPIAGRTWDWYERQSDQAQMGVILTVTDYAAGTGHARFEDAAKGRGDCSWSTPQRRAAVGNLGGDEAWAWTEVRSPALSIYYGRVLVRVGDVLVGVEVTDPSGTRPALRLAEQLATKAARRVAHRIPHARS
ncbi:MAG: hypothetical protein ACXV0U_04670 [Kineosporiaceae bacterium]